MRERDYTADDFLRSGREARIEERRCEYRLEELRAQCERTTASYGDAAPGGGGSGHKDGLLAAVADQTARLRRRQARYIRRIDLVEAFIATLPDVRQRTVLRLRYVDCRRWGDVQQGLREYGLWYEERNVYKLHGAALQEARARFGAWAEAHPGVYDEDDEEDPA